MHKHFFWIWIVLLFTSCGIFQKGSQEQQNEQIRIATYNTSLYQRKAGALIEKLQNDKDSQAIAIAQIIREVRPDILLLQEFDYDSTGIALSLFKEHFLSNTALGQDTIHYRYGKVFASNTGLLSPIDLNEDGKIKAPQDAYGFGYFEGQYAFAVLSRFPFIEDDIRTFQKMLWSDMPDAKIPVDTTGKPYYSDLVWKSLRLSSKNHVDLPVRLPNNKKIHLLLSHPTPPVFDGPEDRNGCRNHDEIRFWKDYIQGADYLVDDAGRKGGLDKERHFVIMGDLNADPVDGDSRDRAIQQLLNLKEVHQAVAQGDRVPSSEGGKAYNRKKNDLEDPSEDTSFFGLRVDYVLPDAGSNVVNTGVFWPLPSTGKIQLSKGNPSDHLLVWIDLEIP
jgi:endonuclease/exonuclease/phosphatase family metal-dependent hydrolase